MHRSAGTFVLAAAIVVLGLACGEEDILGLYPDDDFEPNDSFGYAYDLAGTAPGTRLTDLESGSTANLTYVDESDYYRITIPAGVTDLAVAVGYAHEAGNVALYLYDDSSPAPVRLDSSDDATGIEMVTLIPVAEDEVYYARVDLLSGDASTYDLQWGSLADIALAP